MIRSMIQTLHPQPLALAQSSQGMGAGVWISGVQDRDGICLYGLRSTVQSEMSLSGSEARTEWGSYLGDKPCPTVFLAALGNRPQRRSGVYRRDQRPPVPD